MKYEKDETKQYRLADICQIINGRAYKQNELLDSGEYPVLRVGNFFSSDRWYYSNLALPSEKYCNDGDLLFAWSASFGPQIWHGEKTIYHYHIWKIIPNEDIVNKYFLYYWLRQSSNYLTSGTHGSVMAHITKKDMENTLISLPKIEIQNKIGDLLKDIDNMILLNKRMNENLDQQALSIFKGLNIV